MPLFEKTDCNTGRQACVDVAKVAAIVFMVAIHCMMYGGAELSSGVGLLFDCVFGGAMAAPVFMACMGIGVAYSRKNDAATLLRRGFRMLVAAYIFNAVRAAAYLPLGYFSGDVAHYHRFVLLFLLVDILQFAGMALMLLALLRKLGARTRTVAMVSVAMSLAGSCVAEKVGWLVKTVHTGILALDVPLSLVAGVVSDNCSYPEFPLVYSAFPLLNWFVFVAFGLAIGKLLRRCRNTDRLFAIATPPALLLFVFTTILGMKGGSPIRLFEDEEAFYFMSIIDVLLVAFPAIVFMLGAGHFIGKALNGKAADLVQRTSSDLNRIYLVHWPIVMWVVDAGIHQICGFQMGVWTLLVISFAVLAVSAALSRLRPFSNLKL